jgi:penicillin-binding protein 1A
MSPPRRGRPPGRREPFLPRRRRRLARRGRGHPLLVVVLILTGTVAAVVVGAGAGVYRFGSSCDLSALHEVKIGQNSFVYAADGSLLGAIPAERNRQVVPLSRVSRWMPKATVAIEDRRFYEHGGVDPQGIARAVWVDVKARGVVQGGSTITQQLVRNLYISNERTVQRKLKEACLAIKLSDAWSKQRILAAYLNQVYYGNLAYGIEAAAQTYFSKSARALNLREAALLAGLTQAPSADDPFVEPTKALARRDEVLSAMHEQGVIDTAQYTWARRGRNLGLKPGRLYKDIREPYFFGYVRDELIRAYGSETVRSGGLSVYTTILPRWQKVAQEAIRETLTEPNDPAAAVISIDPGSGAIRAMAAVIPGRRNNQFNLLSQARRQPGSTFKAFVLAAAVDKGIDPDTSSYVSAPFTYKPVAKGNCDDGTWWCVKTYDSTYGGWTSVTRATLRSDNSVYAQLTLDVGPDRVAAMARKLGVRSPLDVNGRYVPSMGLGTIAVSPLDMASAYATLAAGGVYSAPTAIRKVLLPSGIEDTEAHWGKPDRKRVIPDGVAWEVTRILEDNIRYGTGTRAAIGRPAAGKTGTTDKHADAWFVGYTPDLSTAVWMGYQAGEIPMEDVHGIAVSGGSFPAQIWRLYMERTIGLRPARDFPEPKSPPDYKPFHRGPLALSYDPYYVASTDTTGTDTTGTGTAGTTAAGTETASPPHDPTRGSTTRGSTTQGSTTQGSTTSTVP